jgi:hypothetical protein
MMRVVFCCASAWDASRQLYGRSERKKIKNFWQMSHVAAEKHTPNPSIRIFPISTIAAMFLERVFSISTPRVVQEVIPK